MTNLDPQEMMREIESLKKCGEAASESISMLAKFFWIAFENLIEQGFTDEQAIAIIKARGPFLNG